MMPFDFPPRSTWCDESIQVNLLADGIDNGDIAEWAKEVEGRILELWVRLEGQETFEIRP
jgi:hypothetical protein